MALEIITTGSQYTTKHRVTGDATEVATNTDFTVTIADGTALQLDSITSVKGAINGGDPTNWILGAMNPEEGVDVFVTFTVLNENGNLNYTVAVSSDITDSNTTNNTKTVNLKDRLQGILCTSLLSCASGNIIEVPSNIFYKKETPDTQTLRWWIDQNLTEAQKTKSLLYMVEDENDLSVTNLTSAVGTSLATIVSTPNEKISVKVNDVLIGEYTYLDGAGTAVVLDPSDLIDDIDAEFVNQGFTANDFVNNVTVDTFTAGVIELTFTNPVTTPGKIMKVEISGISGGASSTVYSGIDYGYSYTNKGSDQFRPDHVWELLEDNIVRIFERKFVANHIWIDNGISQYNRAFSQYGNPDRPFYSFLEAKPYIKAGDTVIFREGDYQDTLDISDVTYIVEGESTIQTFDIDIAEYINIVAPQTELTSPSTFNDVENLDLDIDKIFEIQLDNTNISDKIVNHRLKIKEARASGFHDEAVRIANFTSTGRQDMLIEISKLDIEIATQIDTTTNLNLVVKTPTHKRNYQGDSAQGLILLRNTNDNLNATLEIINSDYLGTGIGLNTVFSLGKSGSASNLENSTIILKGTSLKAIMPTTGGVVTNYGILLSKESANEMLNSKLILDFDDMQTSVPLINFVQGVFEDSDIFIRNKFTKLDLLAGSYNAVHIDDSNGDASNCNLFISGKYISSGAFGFLNIESTGYKVILENFQYKGFALGGSDSTVYTMNSMIDMELTENLLNNPNTLGITLVAHNTVTNTSNRDVNVTESASSVIVEDTDIKVY